MPLAGPQDAFSRGRRLRRLEPAAYTGLAAVHWTMSMRRPASGWLDELHHARLRELLLHICARYHLACPAYALMPDHGHFLLIGLSPAACQRPAVRLLRARWARLLAASGAALQRQAYDHVLRPEERRRDAFEETVSYILNNPVRGGLVAAWQDWPFSGCCLPGYPALDPRRSGFMKSWWMAIENLTGKTTAHRQ